MWNPAKTLRAVLFLSGLGLLVVSGSQADVEVRHRGGHHGHYDYKYDHPKVPGNLILGDDEARLTETIMPIDPQGRARDYEEAFKAMKAENPDGRAYAIVDGRSIDRIVGVKAMPDQSLVVFTIERGKHLDHVTVKVEDIDSFGQWGRNPSPVTVPDSW